MRISIIAAIVLTLSSCQGGLFRPKRSMLEEAEDLARDAHYEEAIELYQKHMKSRLQVSDRPDWENPFLYLLTIGDLNLRQGKVTEAIALYEEAEKKGISAGLVSDRFRGIAIYYENEHKLEQAVETLKKYRERDPLLFDGMLDRLSKQIVAEEDSSID